ncbi:MAG: VanZ family protein [Bacteroidales bacterium]|nr:VanZ family protein [Bacteroidales bacterium]
MAKSIIIRRLWPALAWALMILIITGVPGAYFPEVVTFWVWLSPDKAVHIFIFGVQAFLLMFAFNVQYLSAKERFVYGALLLLAAILFALLTEVLQAFVFIGRNGNVYDFIADVVGVLAGLLAYILFYKKKEE